MKRSKVVPLFLLGVASIALAGCDSNTDSDTNEQRTVTQNQYSSREDCMKDWGNDPQNCNPAPNGGHGYFGPMYYWNHSGGYPVAVNPDGTTRALANTSAVRPGAVGPALSGSSIGSTSRAMSFSRGGFGSSAHASSFGG